MEVGTSSQKNDTIVETLNKSLFTEKELVVSWNNTDEAEGV